MHSFSLPALLPFLHRQGLHKRTCATANLEVDLRVYALYTRLPPRHSHPPADPTHGASPAERGVLSVAAIRPERVCGWLGCCAEEHRVKPSPTDDATVGEEEPAVARFF